MFEVYGAPSSPWYVALANGLFSTPSVSFGRADSGKADSQPAFANSAVQITSMPMRSTEAVVRGEAANHPLVADRSHVEGKLLLLEDELALVLLVAGGDRVLDPAAGLRADVPVDRRARR